MMKLGFARRAFIRVRDMRYIELLNQIEVERRGRTAKNKLKIASGKAASIGLLRKSSNDMMSVVKKAERREALPKDDQVFLGHILAYQSRFMDAARVFERAGHIDLAIEMFLDLKRYDDAKNFAAKVRVVVVVGVVVVVDFLLLVLFRPFYSQLNSMSKPNSAPNCPLPPPLSRSPTGRPNTPCPTLCGAKPSGRARLPIGARRHKCMPMPASTSRRSSFCVRTTGWNR